LREGAKLFHHLPEEEPYSKINRWRHPSLPRLAQTKRPCHSSWPENAMMTILIIVLVIILLGGGGGYYARGQYGNAGLGGVLGLLLIVLIVLWLAGVLGGPGRL
jgi:hypothetical protein